MTMVNLLALPGEGLKGGITMNGKIGQLRKILDDSNYTVALCGSGMMEEGGFIGIKKQDKAYDIENRYGYGVEEIDVYKRQPMNTIICSIQALR